MLVIDLKDVENILEEKVKEMEASETIGGEQTSAQESAQESESTDKSHKNNDPQKQVENGVNLEQYPRPITTRPRGKSSWTYRD